MARKKQRPMRATITQVNLAPEPNSTGLIAYKLVDVLGSLSRRYWWIILLATSLLVQMHYFHIGHIWDDVRHLGLIGEVTLGRLGLVEYFLRFHNEHFIGLWKIWYIFTWKISGTNPVGWHFGITLGHGLSAIFLYLTLRSYAPDSLAPFAASFLWAGAAIGQWDNPLLWIAASHLSFAIMWLLASMWCMTQCRREQGWQMWAIGMTGSTIAATCTMGVTALLTAALMAQFVLLHQGLKLEYTKRIAWILCWLIPFTCVTAWQVFVLSQADLPTTADREAVTFGRLIQGIVSVYNAALSQLVGGVISDAQSWALAPIVLVGFLALLGGFFDSRLRGITALIFLTCAGYTLIVVRARANMSPEVLASFGRFLYVPTLAWCVVIAVGGTNLLLRLVSRPHARLLIFMLLSCGFLVQQAGLARLSAQKFVEMNHEVVDVLPDASRLMQQIRSELENGESPIVINDFPVFIRPLYQPFSVFRAYSKLDVNEDIFKVRPGTAFGQARLADTLRRLDNPQAKVWLSLLETLESHRQLFNDLRKNAGVGRQEFVIPDMAVAVSGTSKPLTLSEIAGYVLGPDDPINIRPIAQVKLDELANLYNSLLQCDQPIAHQWRTAIQSHLIRSRGQSPPMSAGSM